MAGKCCGRGRHTNARSSPLRTQRGLAASMAAPKAGEFAPLLEQYTGASNTSASTWDNEDGQTDRERERQRERGWTEHGREKEGLVVSKSACLQQNPVVGGTTGGDDAMRLLETQLATVKSQRAKLPCSRNRQLHQQRGRER